MGPDNLHQRAPVAVCDMDNEPMPVSGQINDNPVVAEEIDGGTEFGLDVGRTLPDRPRCATWLKRGLL
jgi:hypothetical protein